MRVERRRVTNWIMIGAMTASAALAIGLMFLIVGYIAIKGISYINPTFITATPKGLRWGEKSVQSFLTPS